MNAEQRSGEDRRATEVTHMTLYEKQLEHDEAIIEIRHDIQRVRSDVHEIKGDLTPISQGITSIVFLFKIVIALGAICAALLGISEFMDHVNHG